MYLACLSSSMSVRNEKDSLVRELVVCQSVINAHVSRTRLRGHDLWFLTATCKGYEGTWVPSTLRASQFVFPIRYQNRWSIPDVWEPKGFDQNRWIRWLGWSGGCYVLLMMSYMWRTALDRVCLVSERLPREYKYVSNVCLEHFAFSVLATGFQNFPLETSSAVWSSFSSTSTSNFTLLTQVHYSIFLSLLLGVWLVITRSFVCKSCNHLCQ